MSEFVAQSKVFMECVGREFLETKPTGSCAGSSFFKTSTYRVAPHKSGVAGATANRGTDNSHRTGARAKIHILSRRYAG